jgi:hypothetical protein
MTAMRASADAPSLDDRFGPPERLRVEHVHRLAPGDLAVLAFSRSHVLTREPAERERVLADVAALAATHPDLAGRDAVDLPYVTEVWRARTADSVPPPSG